MKIIYQVIAEGQAVYESSNKESAMRHLSKLEKEGWTVSLATIKETENNQELAKSLNKLFGC